MTKFSAKIHCVTLLLMIIFITELTSGLPSTEFEHVDGVMQRTASLGHDVVLHCSSNDHDHNFIFWHMLNKGTTIGPTNKYDDGKFKYEILTGNLTIRAISKEDEGIYLCASRALTSEELNIQVIRMLVEANTIESIYEDQHQLTLIKVLVGLIALVIFSMAAFVIYDIWRNRYRYPRYLEEYDDEDTEELFSAPSTSKSTVNSHIVPKTPPTPKFDDVDISTDFKSILDSANEG